VRGVLGGRAATVEKLLDTFIIDGRAVTEHRYELLMDDGRKITAPWDEVEAV
jgi:hypothetical protein